MTENTTTDDDGLDLLEDGPWTEGEKVTCVHSGTSVAWGAPLFGSNHHVLARGQVLTVDRGTLEHRRDLLDLINDPDLQRERWGNVRLVRGTVEIEPWDAVGDAIWILERDRARQLAAAQIDPRERLRMHEENKRRFGAAPAPRNTNQYRDLAAARRLSDDRFARSQQPREINVSRAD